MNVTDEEFQKEVIEKSKDEQVLVDFWASWCAPCLMLKPVIKEAVKEYENKITLVQANTSECKASAKRFNVMAIPNVKLFKNGEVVDDFVGFKSKEEIIKWLKNN